MNAKVDEPKVGDIYVVRDFVDVFPEDLSGLPPQRQVKCIDLVHGATPVAKSSYRLAPLEIQEFEELGSTYDAIRDMIILRIGSLSMIILLYHPEAKRSGEPSRVQADGYDHSSIGVSLVGSEMDEAMHLDNSMEWNFGDDQLRLRWMIYLVVLADAAESVRDTIGFEYCLASSSGWTKSPVLWAEIGESSLTGP
ncbi:hypothetical protein Tco_1125109 [Tanacetum coccineum]|uniref:Reverse transcriptase domain-containing protein n=1 Tax=Tanacetum coccineum TaxID=301880 RepID=A0ABQ5J844_9ASTR